MLHTIDSYRSLRKRWEQRKFSDFFVGLQNNTLSRADLNYDRGNIKNVHYGDVLIKFGEYIDVASAELPYINDNSIESKFVVVSEEVLYGEALESYRSIIRSN